MIRNRTPMGLRSLGWIAGCCALAGSLGLSAWAQSPAQGATKPRGWAALSPAQQTALQPLQQEWDHIDPPRKNKWIEIANRFSTLPPAEQARIQGRMTEWAQLSPRERGQTRLNFKEAQQIAPADRKARWEAYNALSAEERQSLAARAAPASGPSLGPAGARREPSTGKLNTVPIAVPARPKAVAPTVAQAQPGATTIFVTRRPTPPAHQQSGSPKIVTNASLVDSLTLLPKGRTQNPAASATAASAPGTLRP